MFRNFFIDFVPFSITWIYTYCPINSRFVILTKNTFAKHHKECDFLTKQYLSLMNRLKAYDWIYVAKHSRNYIPKSGLYDLLGFFVLYHCLFRQLFYEHFASLRNVPTSDFYDYRTEVNTQEWFGGWSLRAFYFLLLSLGLHYHLLTF